LDGYFVDPIESYDAWRFVELHGVFIIGGLTEIHETMTKVSKTHFTMKQNHIMYSLPVALHFRFSFSPVSAKNVTRMSLTLRFRSYWILG
jgi:hypothetical protein